MPMCVHIHRNITYKPLRTYRMQSSKNLTSHRKLTSRGTNHAPMHNQHILEAIPVYFLQVPSICRCHRLILQPTSIDVLLPHKCSEVGSGLTPNTYVYGPQVVIYCTQRSSRGSKECVRCRQLLPAAAVANPPSPLPEIARRKHGLLTCIPAIRPSQKEWKVMAHGSSLISGR